MFFFGGYMMDEPPTLVPPLFLAFFIFHFSPDFMTLLTTSLGSGGATCSASQTSCLSGS
jgi:hypothetical protein